MTLNIESDFREMENKLKCYVDKGRIASGAEAKEQPMISVKIDASLIRPLKKINDYCGSFMAIDCSTRTLKRANNWGIYLMRPAYAIVQKRNVDWNFEERLCTVIGDAYSRSNYLKDIRIELESQMGLRLLEKENSPFYYDHTSSRSNHDHADSRSNYLLLDGGGYFGGERKFRVSLYEACEKKRIALLAISKNSPSLHDDKGRDLVAATQSLTSQDIWVYYPVRKADKDRSLYGDVSIAKLCAESSYVFRCDIMDYLTGKDVSEVLSPLTGVSEDPRCVGYPISLYLAHEFSLPSNSMLLSYYDQIEKKLDAAGLLGTLRFEERSCSFADEVHGVKHAFEWEWWNDQY